MGKSGYECPCCDSLIIGAKTLEADKSLCPPTLSQPDYSVVFIVNEYRKSNLGLSISYTKHKINETNRSVPFPTVSFNLCFSNFGI
jgi:hypothetical protein